MKVMIEILGDMGRFFIIEVYFDELFDFFNCMLLVMIYDYEVGGIFE